MSFSIVIVVGFERTFSTVEEDVDSFELCVRIFTEISLLPPTFDFLLDLVSITDTAGVYNNICNYRGL